VVAESLGDLNGPVSGVVTLPRHLDWSGSARYDLDRPARMIDLYRTVLIEATKPADLNDHLDRATLMRLWAGLWLPVDLRSAWEQRFPELRPPGSGSAAA
jgi:hypothetical protein